MKIGLLGFGSMGKTHLYCVNNLKYFFGNGLDAKIVSVCTKNIENAKNASEKYGIENYTDNEDDIIYHKDMDAVDICTPNIYHYETAKKAILAGKHVYCEKPLAVTYEQAKELSSLAKEHGVKCHMVFNNRFLSPVLRAKELIEEGKIGRILSFNGAYHHSSALDVNKTGWKQDKTLCGGGVLFDLGSHVVDLIYYLCGKFNTVYGMGQIAFPNRKGIDGNDWKTNADEAFYLLATLENGAVGTITVSKITTGSNDDLTFEIHGEKGSIRFNLMNPNFLEYYSCDSADGHYGGDKGYTQIECVNRYPSPGGVFPGIKAPIGWLRGHLGNYHSFVDCVINDKKPSISFEDGAYVQLVLESAYRSDKLGIKIEVNTDD
ncbi:MAG: Gfo/Idh/MocA family oxidoreductase [Clostridia bacterium]|nr:Gfo/Idh/MocA family oxidoreductase [Clostridia bacterium]